MLYDEIKNQSNPYKHVTSEDDWRLGGICPLYPFILLRASKGMLNELLNLEEDDEKSWEVYASISLLEDAELIYQAHKDCWDFMIFDNVTGVPYSFEKEGENNDN